MTPNSRIRQCAQLIEDTLAEGDFNSSGELLEEMIRELAELAGYTPPEVERAWSIVNELEGA